MEEKKEQAPVEEGPVQQQLPLPSDEKVSAAWKSLSSLYGSRPRLASTLSNGKIDIREESGVKLVDFYVLNEAQKQWIEEKLLRDLENKLRDILQFPKVNILVQVTPDTAAAEKVPYMPEEKAKDLMDKNPEVRAFVADLGLDTK